MEEENLKRSPAGGNARGVIFLCQAFTEIRVESVCGHRTRQGPGHVCVKQAVEEVFAGFAADGEAAGDVGAGS